MLIETDRTSDRILLLLKEQGPQTVAGLAATLSVTVPAVRQHLKRLQAEALARCRTVRRGVGRPGQLWELTQAGHRRFPDAHAETTVALIGAIRASLGEAALEDVIEVRHRAVEARYRHTLAGARSLGERLERLCALRREEGYMAELIERDDGWLLAEHHCPICDAARACQGFCRNELALFRALLPEATVEREEYLLEGGRRCSYRVRVG